MTSFGRTLRLLRRRAGMSQPRLAATVFVSQSTISRFESGDRMPDPALARLIDGALGAGGALSGLIPADPDRAGFQARRPGLVDRAVIVEAESGLVQLRKLEDISSSADVTPMVAARAELAVQAAKDAPYALRAPAIGAAAMGTAYLGWCHFVAGRYAAAEQALDRAAAQQSAARAEIDVLRAARSPGARPAPCCSRVPMVVSPDPPRAALTLERGIVRNLHARYLLRRGLTVGRIPDGHKVGRRIGILFRADSAPS
ncbi:multiprotein-bridging factor 1 family protein [Kitasatospora sp. NPDC059803]|uniref:helix-turn-helix domain-containing protein n=1 Tax=Kitasatospora sp. NPDC059803 TaxID=3346953 RepID=UPI00364A3873